jgi:hypothetical protein
MKKRMILMAIAAMMVLSATAQVEITKFKFKRDEPFGMFPGRKMIDMKFKNTSDRPMKYLKVYYYAVNAVGDVVSGLDAGVRTEGMEYIKPKLLDCMGPFEPGKSYSRWASGVITTKQKGTIAVPYEVEIIYMQNDTTRIKIDGANLKQFFPKNEWREYNRRNQQL